MLIASNPISSRMLQTYSLRTVPGISAGNILTSVGIMAMLFLFLAPSVFAVNPSTTTSPIVREKTNGSSVSSTNWSGYAVNGSVGSVSLVTASWNVPAVSCPTSGSTYSAFWVGIDGFQSTTVEQTGTDSDCHNGVAHYYAWFEFYPKASVTISSIAVSPGDKIAALVLYTASTGMFTVAIKDYTTNLAYSSSSAVPGAQRNSGEWVAEAPETCIIIYCTLSSLSNFGSTGFGMGNTGIKLTCGIVMSGVPGAIGSFPSSSVWPMTMVSQSSGSTVKATPSALTDSGSSFTITWDSAGP